MDGIETCQLIREEKLKIQTAEEAIADLREFIQNDFGAKAYG